MPQPGPRPKPKALTVHEGRRKAREDPTHPDPKIGIPRKPRGMSKHAGVVWREMVKQLSGLGVLTVVDGKALARYCELHVIVWDALGYIAEHGATQDVTGRYGTKTVDVPQIKQVKDLSPQLLRLEEQFGLTPSARSRISIVPRASDADTALVEFFAEGGAAG